MLSLAAELQTQLDDFLNEFFLEFENLFSAGLSIYSGLPVF